MAIAGLHKRVRYRRRKTLGKRRRFDVRRAVRRHFRRIQAARRKPITLRNTKARVFAWDTAIGIYTFSEGLKKSGVDREVFVKALDKVVIFINDLRSEKELAERYQRERERLGL